MVGKTYRVLVDGKDKRVEGALTGRTEGKLPIRILDADEDVIGSFQDIEVTSASQLSLSGRPVVRT
jgi:tRNA-2-methylthio-N6-dimethylallyladenosine synthase